MATRWTIRHGLMLLWFKDLMNVTEKLQFIEKVFEKTLTLWLFKILVTPPQKKGQPISERMKGPLFKVSRSPLIKVPDKRAETLARGL